MSEIYTTITISPIKNLTRWNTTNFQLLDLTSYIVRNVV